MSKLGLDVMSVRGRDLLWRWAATSSSAASGWDVWWWIEACDIPDGGKLLDNVIRQGSAVVLCK